MKWSKRKKTIIFTAAVTAAVVLGGCGEKSDTISMATKPMTEQYIIGSMMKTLIEDNTDLKVDITEGVGGGTSNIWPGMESGTFDFYPEYTGTGWNAVLKEESLYEEGQFEKLQEGYQEYRMSWKGMLGFNNTYGLAVTKEAAEKYNLKKYSDLVSVSDHMTFGAEYDFFEREDGYDKLCSTYDLEFKNTMDLDIGLKYNAIREKKIDAMNIFTTDGQLSASEVVVLEDDKGLYPSYRCGFVVRDEILEQHPELNTVFDMVNGILTDEDMAALNYQVEGEGMEPEEAAVQYLKSKGLVKAKED